MPTLNSGKLVKEVTLSRNLQSKKRPERERRPERGRGSGRRREPNQSTKGAGKKGEFPEKHTERKL